MEPALPTDFYTHKMDRMDPELAKALRDGLASSVPSFGVVSDDDLQENYSRVSTSSAELIRERKKKTS